MAEPNEITKSRLHAIAECLEVPIEAFYDASTISNAILFNEMFLLCISLKTLTGQKAALDALRQISAKENEYSKPDT